MITEQYLYIDQGATFSASIVTGVNLTGFTRVTAQVRKWYGDAQYWFLTATIDNPTTGAITLTVPADITAQLPAGRNVFDVLASVSSGAQSVRIARGQAVVIPGLAGVNPPESTLTDNQEPIEIIKGTQFTKTIELRNEDGTLKDLTGYTAVMEIRPTVDSPVLIKSLTTANGGLIISVVNATVSIMINSADTAAFTFDTAVYELDIVLAGEHTRVLEGPVILKP